jgi:hypothetical protein
MISGHFVTGADATVGQYNAGTRCTLCRKQVSKCTCTCPTCGMDLYSPAQARSDDGRVMYDHHKCRAIAKKYLRGY